ncbi:hypothetical protein E8E13_009795 [Curvularia kusanoi]|uniref:Uncharacterized protein n=1 Tax=Curvularia kusanoi TaxID=90978 RepID=A0A9P4WDV1_CURKU|nr:hypothetical protein E8E13_009795 [Curvularia kusanoi]
MARRSARLHKPAPTPDRAVRAGSNDSWETAQSEQEQSALLELPSVRELPEPVNNTPRKPAAAAAAPKSTSKLPTAKPVGAQTPSSRSTSSKLLSAVTEMHTPTNRTPIKPAGDEMHPALHHASTAKPLDEARWLGFQSLGAHTAPPKAAGHAPGTPSKTPAPTSMSNAPALGSSPSTFRFQFKSPFSKVTEASKLGELSPTTRNLLKEPVIGATPGRAIFGANEFTSKADVTPARKKAEPKGKVARFSDVHMAQFKKMDSVANHPSAWRVKKTPSKPDLPKPEPNKLKRTQSKLDLAESSTKPAAALKRTQSKMDLAESSTKPAAAQNPQPKTGAAESLSRIPPTPLKRTQSKVDLTGSSLPRAQSTVRLVAPQQNANAPAPKRVKRNEGDDAATTRPAPHDNNAEASSSKAPIPPRKITSQTALPRLAARLMTPTKSSAARAQSQTVKVTKTTSLIPQSPARTLFSPAHISRTLRDGARESMHQAKRNLQQVRSILRTPSRKFSDDPAKVAAGTHMSPPPESAWNHGPSVAPATAPVKKHVNFSNSTLLRAAPEDVTKSPSPMKFRAGSEVPSGAVVYPSLGSGVEYPKLPQSDASPTASPSRRLTFGGETASQSRSFSFESGRPVNFGPTTTGTIRMVRKSDASSIVESTKRKLDTLQETSDKENDEHPENPRSAKKLKATPAPSTPAKATASASKTPRRTPGSAMSKSRLAFLATPKRTRA